MAILKRLFAAGALGFVAYKAWQQHKNASAISSLRDRGDRTPPHGDPILAGAQRDVEPPPHAGAHSSRSFGEP